MPPPLSARPLFSRYALARYFQHISLPYRFTTPPSVSAARESSAEGLSYLRALQKYQQATIPFANLYLHYSKHHTSTLHPHELYEYIINGSGIAREGSHSAHITGNGWHGESLDDMDTRQWYPPGGKVGIRGGRGGSCTLNNGFFGTVMRSLGYNVLSGGARVAKAANGGPKDVFGGWDHMVNIVTVEGKKYLVDAGFGGNGPTEPVELVDGKEIQWGVTNDAVRVVYTKLKQSTDPESRVWILQHKRGGAKKWDDIYAFTEVEFLPEDFEVMNYRTTRDPKSWFNQVSLPRARVSLAGGMSPIQVAWSRDMLV